MILRGKTDLPVQSLALLHIPPPSIGHHALVIIGAKRRDHNRTTLLQLQVHLDPVQLYQRSLKALVLRSKLLAQIWNKRPRQQHKRLMPSQ
jgi:hypothetical protein